MYPHRIRLRGPWDCEPLVQFIPTDSPSETATYPLPPRCRMTMPCHWSDGGWSNFAGRAKFTRRFGYPGRIDDFERVWLTCAGVTGTADVWLNGQFLGRQSEERDAFEFEITSLLAARNELVVEVESQCQDGGLSGEVALEVRCTAFLRRVHADIRAGGAIPRLHVIGQVVGTDPRLLELYVLWNSRTIHYDTIQPLPEGRPFEIVAELPAPEFSQASSTGTALPFQVRIELIQGAVVWYAIERNLVAFSV